MSDAIFFILFGAGMYFFGAIVGSGRVKQRLMSRVGARYLSVKKGNMTNSFTQGFISGMKWAVDQVMDEPVDWEKLKEIYDEQ